MILIEFLGNLAKVALIAGCYVLLLGVLGWAALHHGLIGLFLVIILSAAAYKT